ncbi:uncharacterized protein LOC111391778 [Olea europaea var. sylvestris]|uniref:uncharacterized protein LOC111391778 n=1 Tax=Olea europaea var. sylvestris TaxID=158386 RepID=UPI000C1D84CF|nr:uncharacterized protein LOC111391778 [Olea europaea var. sylvestris]
MENGDDWLALDKFYHVLFCFFISITFSLLAARNPYPLIRRYSVWIGSIVSLLAGAAKEFADELGYFRSAGASTKDAAADLIGVLLAALALSLCNQKFFSALVERDHSGQAQVLNMV